MKSTTQATFGSRAGFTITEVVLATGVFSMAMSIMMGAHVLTMREVGGDSNHVRYIDEARASEQFIVNMIQAETAIGVTADGLEVYNQDFQQVFTIRFIDEDGDPGTVDDNTLVSDPDPNKKGDEQVICRAVSPLAGAEMFEIIPTSPLSTRISFHIGELPPENRQKMQKGKNYHGVEVRITATPRNSNYFLQ